MIQHKSNFLYSPVPGNFLSWFLAFIILMPYANGLTTQTGLFIIALFAGSFWTIYLHAYREAERIETKKQEIPHSKRLVVRSLVALFIGIVTHIAASGSSVESIVKGIVAAIFLGTIFWLEFDFMLNYHRGLNWDYTSYQYSSALTDKMFRKKKALWIASKIVLFLLGMMVYNYVLRK